MAGASVSESDRFRHLPACLPPMFSLSLPGVIRRNAVFLTTIFASAFAFEIAFDSASNKVWDSLNRGRQWKDIKHRYIVKEEEDDD
ncbi:cytochrome b-c1 complex subunit 9 [Aspergillus tanneri]|uniref:Complex III subunit 9 n=1 Tax=Aspergillus tanneri TaxID=1220188 RepID=A0A5M9MGG5_9EURO|nr:qcr9 subunit 9 of the ubiquinol cytochrome-c reductase complex [Aspergillus tanneri]KAA8644414.1 qcr9 subunit 9 of the ubiquinol cytochrome-c reductase complex [Aspergillus tanneri]